MARYEFRLPDIGEGIAEAEIVAWHVAIGDEVKEDQQLADMMTDKATVELESPVSGRVVELAGEVGDQIPIGSTLVVLETADGVGNAEAPAEEMPMGDGATEITPELAEAVPSADVEAEDRRTTGERRSGADERRDEDRGQEDRRQGEWRAEPPAKAEPKGETKVLASPAVRARARDLGIDLSQVQFSGDRIRHADLDAFLLY
ncbi:MAG TPA: biotin/lipoyl-containing protein, partial [Allosphingosinicella sp.]